MALNVSSDGHTVTVRIRFQSAAVGAGTSYSRRTGRQIISRCLADASTTRWSRRSREPFDGVQCWRTLATRRQGDSDCGNINVSYLRRVLWLTLLAPDIVE